MKISVHNFRICEAALHYLRMYIEEKGHLFREELLYNGEYMRNHDLDFMLPISALPRTTCRKYAGR